MIKLAENKAAALKNSLVDDFKIDTTPLQASGKGKTAPTESNTAAGNANS